MQQRKNFSTGSAWEPKLGYCRAVRVGQSIFVSGTTATSVQQADGSSIELTTPYDQTVQILNIIENALEQLGAQIRHVVRSTVYVANMDEWEQVGKAHGERFATVMPALTIVEISRFIDSKVLVEIAVDAVIHE